MKLNIHIMKSILTILLSIFWISSFPQQKGNISVGDKAIDFKLKTIQGEKAQLSKLNKGNPVVLVVLRGWPEYQCPVCTRQVGGLLEVAEKFENYDAKILMVYPGPSDQLQEHAKEFTEDFDFPKDFYFTIDPGYTMINKYGLRWDAPKETAYPSTYVINKNGEVVFVKTSETHGGRATVDEILEALGKQ